METSAPLTVGFALDVSGSMKASIQNVAGHSLSRLDGLRHAMDALLAEAARLAPILPIGDEETRLRVFACVYGLTDSTIGVCDLFRLVDVLRDLAKDSNLIDAKKRLASDYERRIRADERSVAIEVMGSAAYSLLGMSRAKAERVVRGHIEQKIKQKLAAMSIQRLRGDLESGMRQTGAVVLTLKELTERWEVLRTGISGSNEFVGGSTPMRQCMEMNEAIFDSQIKSATSGARFILFIVSDGASTDGDPRPAADRLRKRGVQIISCFVSSTDVVHGKHLYTEKRPDWPSGAQAMCDMASSISHESPEFRYLQEAGWQVSRASAVKRARIGFKWLFGWRNVASVKLFAQVNHSALLDEFLRVVLAPLYAESRSN